MRQFNVLIVEDDALTADLLKQQLQSVGAELAPDGELVFHMARTQAEADDRLHNSPYGGYRLVMLDLKYPDNDPTAPEKDNGIKWLPILRAGQPAAAIIVCTSYAHEGFLGPVVTALLDGKAEDFIPKATPWKETLARIRAALQRASDRIGTRASAQPQLSDVRRTVAEDQAMELARTQQRVAALLDRIRAATPELCEAVASIDGELDLLALRLADIGKSLTQDTVIKTEEVDCGELAREWGAYYDIQMREFRGHVHVKQSLSDCVVQTYSTDLTIALRELLQNAVHASRASESDFRTIEVSTRRDGDHIIIQIDDGGEGFPKPVIDKPIEQNRSLWENRAFPHSGMGLYVAHRMMRSIGGSMLLENVEGPHGVHGRVTLIVKDWKMA